MHYSHNTITGPYAILKYDFTVASRAHISSFGSTHKETDLQFLFSYGFKHICLKQKYMLRRVVLFIVGYLLLFRQSVTYLKTKSNTTLFTLLKLKTGPKENVPWKSFTDLFL